MLRTLPQLPPFNWQIEYAPHWEGRNDGCLNDILFRPGPDDVLIIDGVKAKFKHHLDGTAKAGTGFLCDCGETDPHYMWNKTICFACDAGYTNPERRVRMQHRAQAHNQAQLQNQYANSLGNMSQLQNQYANSLGNMSQLQVQQPQMSQQMNLLDMSGIGWPSRRKH